MSVCLTSCASQRTLNAEQRTLNAEQRTLNAEQRTLNASRDTVHVLDSVIIQARNDTVYVDRWRTEWRDRVVERLDTVVIEKHDSIYIASDSISPPGGDKRGAIPRWCWGLLMGNILSIAIVIVRKWYAYKR